MSGIGLMLLGALTTPDAVKSFVSNTSSSSGNSNYTFSGLSLGAEASNRYIIVGVSGVSGASGSVPDFVTVNGIIATALVTNAPSTIHNGIYIAYVPSGTTGTVVVDYSSVAVRVGVVLWRATELISTTATETKSGGASSTSPQSNTIAVSAGGVAFAISYANLGGTSTNPRYSAGSYSTPTATTLAFSVDVSTATNIAWTGIVEDVDPAFSAVSANQNTWYVAASLR